MLAYKGLVKTLIFFFLRAAKPGDHLYRQKEMTLVQDKQLEAEKRMKKIEADR